MTDKLEKMAYTKARTGKASKAWLKQTASNPRTAMVDQLLDTAFPGWTPRRGVSAEDCAWVDDLALAYDLAPGRELSARLKEIHDQWTEQASEGTLSEPLWRLLDESFPGWLGRLGGRRIQSLRLRAVQLAGFRLATGRDPHPSSADAFERSLAGWLRRNRTKANKGVLASRDEQIIVGRIGAWTYQR